MSLYILNLCQVRQNMYAGLVYNFDFEFWSAVWNSTEMVALFTFHWFRSF